MNILLAAFAAALIGEVFGMVALYNMTVNATQSIASARAKLDAVGAATTNLNNKIIAALSSEQAAAMAAKGGMVQEQKPQYVMTNRP